MMVERRDEEEKEEEEALTTTMKIDQLRKEEMGTDTTSWKIAGQMDRK